MIDQGKIKPFWEINLIENLPFQKYSLPNYDKWEEAKHYPKDMVTDKLSPGKVTPWHTDHFLNFKKYYNLDEKDIIHRRLLFLQDWRPGQIFAIDDKTYTNWNAGDWIEWTQEHYHMGANHSNEIRYTAQLTGVKY